MSNERLIECSQPLADALRVRLGLDLRKETPRLVNIGEERKIPRCGVLIDFPMKVRASRVSHEWAWALVKARGDLLLLATYERDGNDRVHVHVVDGARWKPAECYLLLDKTLEEVLAAVSLEVRASFCRHRDGATWKRLGEAQSPGAPPLDD